MRLLSSTTVVILLVFSLSLRSAIAESPSSQPASIDAKAILDKSGQADSGTAGETPASEYDEQKGLRGDPRKPRWLSKPWPKAAVDLEKALIAASGDPSQVTSQLIALPDFSGPDTEPVKVSRVLRVREQISESVFVQRNRFIDTGEAEDWLIMTEWREETPERHVMVMKRYDLFTGKLVEETETAVEDRGD